MHFFLKNRVFSIKIALFSPKTGQYAGLKNHKKEVSLSYETAQIYIPGHHFDAIFRCRARSRGTKHAKISEHGSQFWAYKRGWRRQRRL